MSKIQACNEINIFIRKLQFIFEANLERDENEKYCDDFQKPFC